MKRSSLVLAAALVLVSACGAKPPSVAGSSPAPAAPATAASDGALNCRLTVAGYVLSLSKQASESGAQPSHTGTGGFLDLPSGKFTPVKESDQSYLAGAGVWLPVPMQAVSPDQRTYVEPRAPQSSTTPPTTTLYLVQVATKAERELFTPADGQSAFVLAYTSKGVYVVTTSSARPWPSQLLLIDPVTGASRAVPGSQTPSGVEQQSFIAISGGFVWAMRLTVSQQQPSFHLIRLSLNDASVVDWYDPPGPYFIAGFDADDHPIVGQFVTSFDNVELVVVPDRNQNVAIQPKTGTFVPGRTSYVRDAHGTWFGSGDGSIWLYSSTNGLTKVATVPPQPGGSGQPHDEHAGRIVAGPCV